MLLLQLNSVILVVVLCRICGIKHRIAKNETKARVKYVELHYVIRMCYILLFIVRIP